MRENITAGPIRFRKAYIKSVVDRVEVDDRAIRIVGDKATLEQVMAGINANPNVRSLYASGAPIRIKLRTHMSLKSRYNRPITARCADPGEALIVMSGSGLLDLSGVGSGTLNLVADSTIAVNGGELRVVAKEFANPNGVTLANCNDIYFAESGGDIFAGNITGNCDARLISGTLGCRRRKGRIDQSTGRTYLDARLAWNGPFRIFCVSKYHASPAAPNPCMGVALMLSVVALGAMPLRLRPRRCGTRAAGEAWRRP
jgi:hypothetical protein